MRTGDAEQRQAGYTQVRLLGGFEVVVENRPLTLPLGAQRLVAFVALHQRPVLRVKVAGTLWGDVSEAQASACLRSALWRSNRRGTVIDAQRTHVSLAARFNVDVLEMESVARRVLHGERGTPVEARLFREELLPDWYDDWVIVERERLRQLCLNALERISASLRRGGDVALAIDSALAAVQAEPLRESAYRALIEAHLADGNCSEAVRQYRRLERSLEEELGVGPSESLAALLRSRGLLATASWRLG